MTLTFIITTAFGLEAVVKRELLTLGFDELKTSDGRIECTGTFSDIPRLNIWLRSADRVLIKIGEFTATTFDELFDQTKALNWPDFIPKDAKLLVKSKAIQSILGSFKACQSIAHKAVVDSLQSAYQLDWLPETGQEYVIQVALLKDTATLTLDTSGVALHKRGYRSEAGEAPLKETLAAALVQLSYWKKKLMLIDPMCGSGTILIEAALIAANIAPGLNRDFCSEDWLQIPADDWERARSDAKKQSHASINLIIKGYDKDAHVIAIAKENAKQAGVSHLIHFEQKDINDLWLDQEEGLIISNPPYGLRLDDFYIMNQLYISLHKMLKKKFGWSVYVLTSDRHFPSYFKRAKPDKIRKLFNGRIEVRYYQYF
jgi:putative N6-adenine-specific DNA methylase